MQEIPAGTARSPAERNLSMRCIRLDPRLIRRSFEKTPTRRLLLFLYQKSSRLIIEGRAAP